MTTKDFIKKYRGNYPDVLGRTPWTTWADVEKDMEADLLLLMQQHNPPLPEEVDAAATEYVFEENGMRWSNNDSSAGDNYGSFKAGVIWVIKQLGAWLPLSKVTRVEVITENGGRVYGNRNPSNKVEVQLQDDNRTLKVFISKKR